jgi:nucleotide-binding universal stress UspA family protein
MVALSLSPSDSGLLQYANRALPLVECEQVRFVHIAAEEKTGAGGTNKDELREKMKAEVEEHCPNAGDRAAYDVAQGPRLDRLLELATEHKSDVIMLGHRRARSGRRSLARRLAMIAPCSVWLVPEGSPARLRRIMTPIDFSAASGDALSLATRISATHASEVCLALHVYFDDSAVQYDEHILEVQGNEQAAFEKLLRGIDRQGVEVTPVFEESSHPPEAILRVAGEHDVDLLVMATRGRSRASAILLGSTTSATMATTPIPMLAVKHFGSRLSIVGAILDHRHWGKSPKTN